jgi:phosphoglycerate dehydrogenase-like enzyme
MSNEALEINADRQTMRPKVAVLLSPARREQVLAPQAEMLLANFAAPVFAEGEQVRPADLPSLLDGAVACLTGWGTPPLTPELLAGCPSLRLVAHTAGSVRHLVPLAMLQNGLRISQAAAMIAESVAEFIISQALTCLRQLNEMDKAMKADRGWEEIRTTYPGRLLGSQTVGVVGTGRVGRAVIHLLKAFGCQVLAQDPYLTTEQAAQLGVEAVQLDELLRRSDIVTLHAPLLPETVELIGKDQLALLHDRAIFINAARAPLVDEEALFQELASGRIVAALDVFSKEPLPLDSPFRSLFNVLITPHAAGHTIDSHLKQGQTMVEEVQRFLRGEKLLYEIVPEMFSILA